MYNDVSGTRWFWSLADLMARDLEWEKARRTTTLELDCPSCITKHTRIY